jgi:transposase
MRDFLNVFSVENFCERDFSEKFLRMFSKKSQEAKYAKIIEIYNTTNQNMKDTTKFCDCSRQTVNNALAWKSNGASKSPPRGRPSKLSRNIKLFVLYTTIAQPTITGNALAVMIQSHFGVTASDSLINDFRKNISFKYGRRIPVIQLSPSNKLHRVQFASTFLASGFSHRHIIFSDEK